MAGDWMKMRTNLWDDPRVGRIVDLTDSTEATVVGGLYWLWSMADQHTEDGWLPGMSLRQIDRKSGVPGLGQALVDIGWLEGRADGVLIVRFDDHNGKSAKKRCQTASRVAKHKAGNALETQPDESGNAMSVTESVPGRYLEKRREEKIFTPDTSTQAPDISGSASDAGRACRLMRAAGCHTTNPSHPALLAALGEGVTPEMLADTVTEGLSRGPPVAKPFPWAITTARSRHAEGTAAPTMNSGNSHAARRQSPAERVQANIDRAEAEQQRLAGPAVIEGHAAALVAHG
jgi:hypothetical protein